LVGFLHNFNGHNNKITQEFTNHYEQGQTKVGDFSIPLNPRFLSKALDLPLTGEEYHKGLHFKEKGWTFFLEKQRKNSFDRSKGIERDWFREPWSKLVLIIKRYFTCGNRHNLVYLYHIRLIQHIKGESKINLLYFFLRSLIKMIESVKNKTEVKEAHIYHQGFIKILVEHQVRSKGLIWK